MKNIKCKLDKQGFCILFDLRFDDARIANNLGKIVAETDIKIKHEGKGPLVTSSKALDLHTDHHAVKYIVWYCLNNSSPGGESILSDFNSFYDKLTSDEIVMLQDIFLYEHDAFNDGVEKKQPLLRIEEDDKKMKIYFSFWLVDPCRKDSSAVKAFHKYATEASWEFRLDKVPILIIDNQRILHGQMPILDSDRYLRRFWIC